MFKNIPIPEFSSIAFTILHRNNNNWIPKNLVDRAGTTWTFPSISHAIIAFWESRSPFSSGLLEDRANGVWQDGSHRRRAEADNAKLVLEDRGSDTTTPLNWNLKSIRAAPHPLAGGGGEKKRKMEKKEDWYPGKSNWKITVAKIDWRHYYRPLFVDEHRDPSRGCWCPSWSW